MPRNYTPKPGAKVYKHYTDDQLAQAVSAVQRGLSYRKAAVKYKIPRSVINRRCTRHKVNKQGGQTVLGDDVEAMLVSRLKTCGQWGFPLDTIDLRMIVKGYLDRRGLVVKKFKNNEPGVEWVNSFLHRHRASLAQRICQNIKRNRAAVSRETVTKYFNNLADSVKDVVPANIINYDETNLADDPGRKKVILRRGTKYPERIMNQSKSATSVMYAGTADGTMLPPYVVYKATNMYDTWTTGGPSGTRYNRSKSGWFDMHCFSDWFMKIVIPYTRKLSGKKVLIGDNLSSHLSEEVIDTCEKNNIAFVFLPANSTHLCQPLDVSFFRPMKTAWRKIVEKWKKGPGRKQASIPKDTFPQLLLSLTDIINTNAEANLKSGFEACGIFPLNPSKVINKLPDASCTAEDNTAANTSAAVDDSFTSLLQSMRYDNNATHARRKRKIEVEPGKSVTGADIPVGDKDKEVSGTDTEESAADDDATSNSNSDDDDDNGWSTESESSSTCSDDENADGGDDADIRMETGSDENNNEANSSNTGSTGYTGVMTVKRCDIKVNTWLVVDFAEHSKRSRKRQMYLGQVVQILQVGPSQRPSLHQEYEGLFLRQTKSKDNGCFIYPEVEDRCVFSISQVIGSVSEPDMQRRNVLKFAVHASEWK